MNTLERCKIMDKKQLLRFVVLLDDAGKEVDTL